MNKRVNILLGVTDALCYMHHDVSPPIVHGDISSKNILLDRDQEAHVSDFGTARLLKPESSHWTAFAGTFGYAAPVHVNFHLYMTCNNSHQLSTTGLCSVISSRAFDHRTCFHNASK